MREVRTVTIEDPLAHVRVGDPKLPHHRGEACLAASEEGFLCGRIVDHHGWHVANGRTKIVATWWPTEQVAEKDAERATDADVLREQALRKSIAQDIKAMVVTPQVTEFDRATNLALLSAARVVEWEWHRRDHQKRCCREHGTHSVPHAGCILR